MISEQAINRIVQYYGREILDHDNMEISRASMQHGAVSTYEHSLLTARLAVRIADRLHLWHHVNLRALVRIALLHDYFLYDWHERGDGSHRLHGFRHGFRAARNAERDFGLTHIERNGIRHHMFPLTPLPPRYLEGIIVSLADKISATRETFQRRRRARVR